MNMEPKENAVLELIKEDKAYETYFFNKVSDLKWFYPLKERGYFSPEKAPTPIPAQEKGFFTIPFWNTLDYLEKISLQVKEPKNEKYAIELLDIIQSITRYQSSNKSLDNYRIWWYFVKILNNIPNEIIISYLKKNKISIEDWLVEWTTSNFGGMVPESDIATILLPKFLTDKSEEVAIAEQIFSVMTQFKVIKKEKSSVFGRENDIKPKFDDYWLTQSTSKNHKKIGQLFSKEALLNFAKKVKNVLEVDREDNYANINASEKVYQVKAERIHKEDNEFEYVEFSFLISIGRFKQADVEKEEVKANPFMLHKVDSDVLRAFEISGANTPARFRNKIIDNLKPEEITDIVFDKEDFDQKLGFLYEGLFNDHSHIWLKSLSNATSEHSWNASRVFMLILRDILKEKCEVNKKMGQQILEEFLSEKYQFPIFRRLVLFLVNLNWDEYATLFDKFLDVIKHPFDESDYEVELYELFSDRGKQFNQKLIERLDKLIKIGPRYNSDDKEKYEAYWKQKWYAPLRSIPKFQELYQAEKPKSKIDEIEPPEKEDMSFKAVVYSSPISKENLMSMECAAIADYLSTFKGQGRRGWDEGPTKQGLAEALKSVAEEQSEKFVRDISAFDNTSYLYVYYILGGIKAAWNKKKTFDWERLFNFLKKYISASGFWEDAKQEQGEDWQVDHVWIINDIADLIQDGTRDDSWAFDEKYFPAANEILSLIIKSLEVPKDQKVSNDAPTHVLNSSWGRTIVALVLLGLRKGRVSGQQSLEKETDWGANNYEILFQKNVIEAYIIFGQYMANLAYLDRGWLEAKIRSLESFEASDYRWQMFMEGYVFGRNVYVDLYDLMRNHYIKAIQSGLGTTHDKDRAVEKVNDRLVQHIAIGYLRGKEDLDSDKSLFNMMLKRWKYDDWQEIVSFFWSQREYIVRNKQTDERSQKQSERMLSFWEYFYKNRETIAQKIDQNYPELLSRLSFLTILLDRIDAKTFEWLKLSAPHAGRGYNESFFIEYLDRFDDKDSVEYVGKIFQEMIFNKIMPIFQKEYVQNIIKKMFKHGFKDTAKEICNFYMKNGSDFLREIYEESSRG